ncbi:hypothetical protein WJR50_15660 [Catalinimonas sp. 4WD22]|uniref:hypothetical protein n=1 Tax=Catalinimonas locisalis TaxID=3133978 RepID=UPI003100F572
MQKITRHTFLKQSLQLSTLALAFPTHALPIADELSPAKNTTDQALMKRLVKANDSQLAQLLASKDEEINRYSRRLGYAFGMLSAAYSNEQSTYHQSPEVSAYLEKIVRFLLQEQRPDGTMNAGNLESPPDTAFLVELLCAGTSLLVEEDTKALEEVKSGVKQFLLKAGDALTVGGVHTPNHRWVISAALARLNALYPNEKYVNRIHDWLGEGIYIDSDGHFLERSRNYSEVVDRALITISRLLDIPSLLEPVRKNLNMTYYYMEPNGELVTVDSRRQDQYSSKSMVAYYLHYRYLAIRDQNHEYAGICRIIEQFEDFGNVLDHALVDFMEEPLLQQELPKSTPPPTDFEKFFTTSHLARIRRGDSSTTIFGGVDWPMIIASGRANSPNFFSFRKGDAVLKYMRLSSQFFSMGYFRSEGLKKEGNKYVLHQKLEVPYYQPLPQDKRRQNGDYALTPSIDDRFWNKMSFADRPTSNIKMLETTVTVEEKNGSNEVSFEVNGQDEVAVTIELCFEEEGELSGVSRAEDGEDNFFLEEGTGEYKAGDNSIQFGPGTVAHRSIHRLEGEKYSSHFGSLRTEGKHVYLTGITPFKHTLTFR